MVKSIVDHSDDVKVEREVDEMGVLLTLTVSPEDMGQVIGRQGATAKSIRTLLRVIGAKNNARVNLKINEPEGSERGAAVAATPDAAPAPAEAETEAEAPTEETPAEEKPVQSVEDAIDDLNL